MISVNNVTYTYPFCNNSALRNVSLNVLPGEITLCTGASGCGKSTLIRIMNGLCPHYYKGTLEGQVLIDREDGASKTIAEISSKVGTLFQDPEQQFFALHVDDEMAFALEWKGFDKEVIEERITRSAKRFGIEDILHSAVYKLSEGQKQKVGLGGIFAMNPSAIILDEPSANLDVKATEELAKSLLELKKAGIAIFIADHRLYWLREIADKVIVMSNGEIVAEGSFSILDDEMRKKYGLRSSKVNDCRDLLPDCSNEMDNAAVSVHNLSFKWPDGRSIFKDVSFSLPFGITALLGNNGEGKTTLARLLTGLTKPDKGTVTIKGRTGLILQNADHQLYMKTVGEEIDVCLTLSGKYPSKKEREVEIANLLRMFALEGLIARHPQSLSGGEKQRLVIACGFAQKPELLILDEPTSGLDGANMERIANALETLSETGVPVLLITHDLELIEKICKQALRLPLSK